MEEMLLHTENIDEATDEVEAAGGHVLLQLGHNLLVAKVPSQVAKQNSFSQVSSHIPSTASAQSLNHVIAYWMSREKKLKPKPIIQRWTEKTAPVTLKRNDSEIQGALYRLTMTGKIAAMFLIASGPGNLAISQDEKLKIISECKDGVQFWAEKAHDNGVPLLFEVYYGKATISASNPTSCSSYESCHNVFVDPTLQALNYPPGQAGMDQLAQYIQSLYMELMVFTLLSFLNTGYFILAISFCTWLRT